MRTSRKIFAAFAGVFAILLVLAAYDFSRRTSFPGSRVQDTLKGQEVQLDTSSMDTTKVIYR